MANEVGNIEMQKDLKYPETEVGDSVPAQCVDGRHDKTADDGPQMLGGSLHPVLLWAISGSLPYNTENVSTGLRELKAKGFGIGVHIDEHSEHADPSENKSGCGFADKMRIVFQKAIDQEEEIRRRIKSVYEQNKEKMGEIDIDSVLDETYNRFKEFGVGKIETVGKNLIDLASNEEHNAQVVKMVGDHLEQACFVNLAEGKTLAVREFNNQGNQAFNLDLWMAVKQAKALGVDTNFAIGASLALYVATEMVLVEDKNNPALPVIVRA